MIQLPWLISRLGAQHQGTLGFSAVIAGIIGYCLTRNRKAFENAISCVVIGIAALIIMMPQSIVATAGAVLHAANAADAAAWGVALPVWLMLLSFCQPAMQLPALM